MNEPKTQNTKQERIVEALTAYLALGAEVGVLCERREALLKRARRNGLKLHQPIQLPDGSQFELRKTEGKYVRFAPVELKKVPKFKRNVPATPEPAHTAEASV